MSAMHTPGPWVVEDGEKLKIMATTPRGLKKSVALVGGYGGESRPANARLISAAPDLLAALEEARDGLRWYQDSFPQVADGSDDEAMARIDAAIAKATDKSADTKGGTNGGEGA
jgi:uncharacterized membrane protein YdfJ with MMPL/SSD domain